MLERRRRGAERVRAIRGERPGVRVVARARFVGELRQGVRGGRSRRVFERGGGIRLHVQARRLEDDDAIKG